MKLDRGAASGDGGAAVPGYERLLARHGVITHVAVLPQETPGPDVSRFRRDAAQVARNLLPLGPAEWGLHLDPDVPIPTGVAHSLRRPSGLAPPDPGPSGYNAAIAPKAGEAAGETAPASTQIDESADADAPTPPPTCDDRLRIEVEALSRRISDFASRELADQVAEALAPTLTHLLDARLEPLARTDCPEPDPCARPAPEHVDPLPQERIDAFWAGLEAALRLLDTKAREIQESTAELSGGRIGTALEEVEAAVSLGFEAAGEARESFQSRTDARLSRLEALLSHALPTLQAKIDGLADLGDKLDDLAGQGPLSEGVGSDGRDEIGRRVLSQLEELGRRLEARGGLLDDSLDATHRSAKHFWRAAEDAVARLDTALGQLTRAVAQPTDSGEPSAPAEEPKNDV